MTAARKTAAPKLTVYAPLVPGHEASVVAECDTLDGARAVAARFEHRKDLRMQDVFIRLGRDGEIIERCGPCR